MQIEMTKDHMGSPDGSRSFQYRKGEVVNLPESLAKVFLKIKCAKKYNAPPEKTAEELQKEAEAKALIEDTENKKLNPVTDNK